jgi:hypothetical protein
MSEENQTKDAHFNEVCNGICLTHNFEATVIVTAKADASKGKVIITLYGNGPNKGFAIRLKDAMSAILSNVIDDYYNNAKNIDKTRMRLTTNAD